MNTREYTPQSQTRRDGAEAHDGDEVWLHLAGENTKPYEAVSHEPLPETQVVAEKLTPQRRVSIIAMNVIYLRKTAQSQQNGSAQMPKYGDYEPIN